MKAAETMAPLAHLRREMDRLFERVWDRDLPELVLGEWTPRLDMSETRDALLIRMELPGISPEDIQVTLEEDLLTVRGEKRSAHEEKDEQFYRRERSYGAFARTVRLPARVEPAKVNASFANGVLTISMPRATALKGTAIPVKLGAA